MPKPDTDERYNNNLFGQFKGFTITPIRKQAKSLEPTKPAPPPPTIPTVAIKTNIKPIHPKSNPSRASLLNPTPPPTTSTTTTTTTTMTTTSFDEAAPTLPPLNPGCTARPLISSPVLAATTCTSVELSAKLVNTSDGPTRPAPAPPLLDPSQKPQRPSSTPLANVLAEGERKGGTLNRIASMLRPGSGGLARGGGGLGASQASQRDAERGASNSLPRSHHLKASKVMDKEILRSLEISNPIPQREIEIPTPSIPVIPEGGEQRKASGGVVLRAQSMRDSKVTPRPAIQTFGSMRHANAAAVKRPTSIPASARPTTAPPPVPPSTDAKGAGSEGGAKIPGLPGYQNPRVKGGQQRVAGAAGLDNAYDDCMNLVAEPPLTKIAEESPTSSDNIYAVIEEALPEKGRRGGEGRVNEYKLPKRVEAVASEPMGLLSEIVSEISNRNFDSIYSTASLSRKVEEEEEEDREERSKSGEVEGGYNNGSFGGYMNSSHYKSPGSSIYSNSPSAKFNSSSSTTSSGYLNPSALNVPRQQGDDKSASSTSNLNEEISKELGMKGGEDGRKSAGKRSFGSQRGVAREEEGAPKAGLGRTKTPPGLGKGQSAASNASRPKVQCSDGGSKAGGCGRQGADAEGAKAQPSDSPARQDTVRANNRSSLKTVPCSPKDNGGKLNSPDLVSSCSNSNQINTKSPDVVNGNNPKVNLQPKNVQKTPTLSRGGSGARAPATPVKPLNIASKGGGLAEKRKSPTGGANPIKSLPAKESGNSKVVPQAKACLGGQKAEAKGGEKTNPVQRAASGKSNVASLQQKFEANKNANAAASRTIPSVHKAQRTVGKTTETASVKK